MPQAARLSVVVLVFTCSAAHMGCGANVTPTPPRLRAVAAIGNVGEVKLSADRLRIAVTLHNDGDAALIIHSIESLCGCAGTSLSNATIAPRQTATLHVLLDCSVPGKRNSQILIDSNNSDQRIVRIPFSWEPVGRYKLSRDSADFGDVAPGSPTSLSIGLRPIGTGIMESRIESLPTVETSPSELKCKVVRAGDGYALSLTFDVQASHANGTGDVRVFAPGSTAPDCILPVRWRVRPDLDASPRALYLGKGLVRGTLSGRVFVSSSASASVNLRELALSATSTTLRLSPHHLPDGRVQVDITLQCPDQPGFVNLTFTASVGGEKRRQVIVPVIAIIMEDSSDAPSSP